MKLGAGDFFGTRRSSRAVAGFRFTETEFEAHAELPLHAHELPHFCLVLEGNYTERVGVREAERSASTLLFHPAELEHVEAYHSRSRHFVIEVEPCHLDGLRERGSSLSDPMVFEMGAPSGLGARLFEEFKAEDEFSALALEGVALELLVCLLRGPTRERRTKSRSPAWLGRATEIVRESYSRPPTLASLAASVGVHPVYLASTFRKHHGCTVGEFVRRLRIDRACSRILVSDDSLVEIALATGFADQSHFSRSFKRVTGMTPAQYRRVFRGR